MEKDCKEKNGCLLKPGEAAEYLRWLADQVEMEAVELAEAEGGLDWLIKIKESVKTKTDHSSHKIKIKISAPLGRQAEPAGQAKAPAFAPGGKDPESGGSSPEPSWDSFKKLKKLMANEFSSLKKAVKSGHLPEIELAAAFHQHCLSMTGFPGRGEEHFPAFEAAAEEMLQASRAGDLEGLAQALGELGKMKSNCHKS